MEIVQEILYNTIFNMEQQHTKRKMFDIVKCFSRHVLCDICVRIKVDVKVFRTGL